MMKSEAVEFRIDVAGEQSGEQYKGKFKALPRLSHRLELLKDQKRRELIGAQPGNPSPQALVYATVMSELSVRLVEWPRWWPEVGFGLDLEDEAPLVEINEAVKKIVEAEQKRIQAAGDAAEAKIRGHVTKSSKAAEEDDTQE